MERRWKFLWFIWSKGHFFKPQKKTQWVPINSKSSFWTKTSFINPAVLMQDLQTDRKGNSYLDVSASTVQWHCDPVRYQRSWQLLLLQKWSPEERWWQGKHLPSAWRESGAAGVPMKFLTLLCTGTPDQNQKIQQTTNSKDAEVWGGQKKADLRYIKILWGI